MTPEKRSALGLAVFLSLYILAVAVIGWTTWRLSLPATPMSAEEKATTWGCVLPGGDGR